MSAYTPLVAAGDVWLSEGPLDAAAMTIAAQQSVHFQSKGAFATAGVARSAKARRTGDRLFVVLALTAALSVVLPAICMALAGGTPA